jgi:hypothetical protein
MRELGSQQAVISEDITYYEHSYGGIVKVLVHKFSTTNGVTTKLDISNMYSIYNEDYEELMSAYPSWSPQKPAGVFRKEDLWHFVDLIRSRG